jgi:hypothetical protein
MTIDRLESRILLSYCLILCELYKKHLLCAFLPLRLYVETAPQLPSSVSHTQISQSRIKNIKNQQFFFAPSSLRLCVKTAPKPPSEVWHSP